MNQKVEDYNHNPMKWLEPLIVRLAGETHLESTIPLLVNKLIEDSDDLRNAVRRLPKLESQSS